MANFYEINNSIINLDAMEHIHCKDFLTRYKESKSHCMILESEQIECYQIIFTTSRVLELSIGSYPCEYVKQFDTKEERDAEYNRIKQILLK